MRVTPHDNPLIAANFLQVPQLGEELFAKGA